MDDRGPVHESPYHSDQIKAPEYGNGAVEREVLSFFFFFYTVASGRPDRFVNDYYYLLPVIGRVLYGV